MNLGKRFGIASLVLVLAVSAAPAVAGNAVAPPTATPEGVAGLGVGTWEGGGNARAVGGQDLGAFDVTLTRTGTSTGSRTEGRVVLADGKTITFWQNIDGRANGFRVTSNTGVGGGHCFANGMCQLYEVRQSDGHAFATTVVKDGERRIRILMTELERGSAVRFFEQTLTKKD